jgi:hypothetical protein
MPLVATLCQFEYTFHVSSCRPIPFPDVDEPIVELLDRDIALATQSSLLAVPVGDLKFSCPTLFHKSRVAAHRSLHTSTVSNPIFTLCTGKEARLPPLCWVWVLLVLGKPVSKRVGRVV